MYERLIIMTALIGIFLVARISNAGEVDHFSARSEMPVNYLRSKKVIVIGKGTINFYKQAHDSKQILNKLTNESLNGAVRDYNRMQNNTRPSDGADFSADAHCDKIKFARSVGDFFLKHVIREFSEKAFDRRIDIFNPVRSETIYKDLNGTDGPSYKSKHQDDIISPLIAVGDYRIGSDKLDHFFEFGDYLYTIAGENKDITASPKYVWEPMIVNDFGFWDHVRAIGYQFKYRSRNDGVLQDALEFNTLSEIGAFGLSSNGVFSYADLMANYKGFQFYQSFFAEKDPYFTCENGSIQRTERQFDWLEHIDDAWDESINCNKYGSLEIESKVNGRISEMGFNGCPVVEESCKNLGKKYKNIQEYVLNPNCHSQD